jgi:hypothetical protein
LPLLIVFSTARLRVRSWRTASRIFPRTFVPWRAAFTRVCALSRRWSSDRVLRLPPNSADDSAPIALVSSSMRQSTASKPCSGSCVQSPDSVVVVEVLAGVVVVELDVVGMVVEVVVVVSVVEVVVDVDGVVVLDVVEVVEVVDGLELLVVEVVVV